MQWIHRLRLRVLTFAIAGVLAVLGLIGLVAWPVVPVIGVAVITAAAVVNTMTARLKSPVCHQCGASIARNQEQGVYGVICHHCGAVNSQDLIQTAGPAPGDPEQHAPGHRHA